MSDETEREPNPPVTVTLDGAQILARSQALYRALPEAGFTAGTFEELGIAARAGVPFSNLSPNLKRTIFTLVRDFSDELAGIELAEAVAAGEVSASGGPPGEGETQTETPKEDASDEPFAEDPAKEDTSDEPFEKDPEPAEEVPPVPPPAEEKQQPPAAT